MKAELRIKNFRKLENVTINLRPTTFLLGPNDSGKSTFIKALFFLLENLKNPNNVFAKGDKHLYDFPDKNVFLQSFKNIVTGGNVNKTISFKFNSHSEISLKNRETFETKYGPTEIPIISGNDPMADDFIIGMEEDEELTKFKVNLEKAQKIGAIWASDKIAEYIKLAAESNIIKDFMNISKSIKFSMDVHFTKNDFKKELKLFFDDYIIKIAQTPHDKWDDIESIHKNKERLANYSITPQRGKKNDSLKIKFYNEILDIIIPDFPLKVNKISTDIIGEIYQKLSDNKKISELPPKERADLLKRGIFLYYQLQILIPEIILNKLDIQKHFAALRQIPKHKYILINNEFDNNEYYSLLNELPTQEFYSKKNEKYKNLLALSHNGYAHTVEKIKTLGFGKEIYVVKTDEQIGYVKLKTSNNKIINLCDASSGLLQIFPILFLIGLNHNPFDGDKSTMFSVEQPELHLHPKLQSKLAEILVGEDIFIETHSEHIIKKIQIMFAENKISDEDVIINYFGDESGKTSIKKMELDENGFFTEPWPNGFFEESYELTKQLLKAQRN